MSKRLERRLDQIERQLGGGKRLWVVKIPAELVGNPEAVDRAKVEQGVDERPGDLVVILKEFGARS
jgi:hypothetical protein